VSGGLIDLQCPVSKFGIGFNEDISCLVLTRKGRAAAFVAGAFGS